MDFRHLIVTCLFSMLRLSFETQKIKENYAILVVKRRGCHNSLQITQIYTERFFNMLITNVVYLCKSVQFCGEYEFSTPSFIFSSMSVDHVKSAVGNQCFRNPDTLRSLMVFQQGCYDAGQCQCRSVQCVAKFGFLFSATIAAF